MAESISNKIKTSVAQRAGHICEYCRTPSAFSITKFSVEHILSDHFCWDTSLLEIVGLTPTGRATVEALKLNRKEVCNLRAILFLIGEHPPII